MPDPRDALCDHVVAYWGPFPGQYGIKGAGRIVAVATEPQFVIERPDGSQFHWAASLCKPIGDGRQERKGYAA